MMFKYSYLLFFIVFINSSFNDGDAIQTVILKGKAVTPVFTPFKADGSLDLQQIPPYAAYLKKNGLTTISILALPGEPYTLNYSESVALVKAWIAATQIYGNAFTLLVEVGYLTVEDSCKFAQLCEQLNIPALFYKIPTIAGAKTTGQAASDFSIIAECAPNTPVFYVYNTDLDLQDRVPGTGEVVRILVKNVPNFAGVVAPIEEILQVRSYNINFQGQLIVYYYDSICAAISIQADAYMTAFLNIYPVQIRQIEACYTIAGCVQAQEKVNSLATPLCSLRPKCRIYCPINILKAALEQKSKSSVKMVATRPPTCPITSKDRSDVAAIFLYQ